VLERVREKLCPNDPSPLVAELYNLNVYGPGGHFAPHKDTPRGDDMLGTLVVCLPWPFYGGRLVVSHGGARKFFDWGKEISPQNEPSRIHWAAFFGDVDHSIEEVRVGQRLTLTYVLRRGAGANRTPVLNEAISEQLQAALVDATLDPRFFAKGVTLGFPCFHMYSRQAAFQDSKRVRFDSRQCAQAEGARLQRGYGRPACPAYGYARAISHRNLRWGTLAAEKVSIGSEPPAPGRSGYAVGPRGSDVDLRSLPGKMRTSE
jgi:hypothetical protein